ncbi:hypothetical protein AGMMS50267_03310 [Spirochaetia bacterium]|nr:hypothetical protein AGMMS50267_03310 [Spirochaetia bacterium]
MGKGIFRFELEGEMVLGLDTGLNAQAFAQAKMGQIITEQGYLVFPRNGDTPGTVEPWRPGGVIEWGGGVSRQRAQGSAREAPEIAAGTMVIWGPDFAGEQVSRVVGIEDAGSGGAGDGGIGNESDTGDAGIGGPGNDGGNAALKALGHWVRARILLRDTITADGAANPWPGAALIAGVGPVANTEITHTSGTILFLPDQLIRRVFYAEGPDAWIDGVEHWTHPDRSGAGGDVFTAAAMFYRILCGVLPYPNRDVNVVRQDLREGIFVPPCLIAPGLNDAPAALITTALTPASPAKGKPPTLEDFAALLAAPIQIGDFFHPVSDAERAKLDTGREQFNKRTKRAVDTKRFVRRNITILGGASAALAVIALVITSFVRADAARPTTKGMEPVQVVEAYYGAFNTLDHTLMDACVIGKAGKGDISVITNVFVMGRMRQAYEYNAGVMTPAEWLEKGGGPSERSVFGLTDLRITGPIDTGHADYRVSYLLWTTFPVGETDSPAEQTPAVPDTVLPSSTAITDTVRLERDKKGLWHIAEIVRTPF